MFGSILFLTNCSVQKRVHLKGWNVEWKAMHLSKQRTKSIQPDHVDSTISQNQRDEFVTNQSIPNVAIFKHTVTNGQTEINKHTVDDFIKINEVKQMLNIKSTSIKKEPIIISNHTIDKEITPTILFFDVLLILLGFLILILCVLGLLNALSAEIAGGIMLGVIALVIGLFLGLSLLILGIVLLAIHNTVKHQDRKKSEVKMEKETTAETTIESETSAPEHRSETVSEESNVSKSNMNGLWIIGAAAALIALFFILK